jgi:hypothetical protein
MIMIYLDSSQSTSLDNVYFRSRRLNGTTSLPCYLPSLLLNWVHLRALAAKVIIKNA